jgi:hypothetical protein
MSNWGYDSSQGSKLQSSVKMSPIAVEVNALRKTEILADETVSPVVLFIRVRKQQEHLTDRSVRAQGAL